MYFSGKKKILHSHQSEYCVTLTARRLELSASLPGDLDASWYLSPLGDFQTKPAMHFSFHVPEDPKHLERGPMCPLPISVSSVEWLSLERRREASQGCSLYTK